MLISALIKSLEIIKEKEGDIDVGYEFDPYMSNQWIGRIGSVDVVVNPDNVIDVPQRDNHKYKGKILLLR
jgi:hypothetical protein